MHTPELLNKRGPGKPSLSHTMQSETYMFLKLIKYKFLSWAILFYDNFTEIQYWNLPMHQTKDSVHILSHILYVSITWCKTYNENTILHLRVWKLYLSLAGAPRHASGRKGLQYIMKNIIHEMYKKHWWYRCTLHYSFDSRFPSLISVHFTNLNRS